MEIVAERKLSQADRISVGQRFGRWTVLGLPFYIYSGGNRHSYVQCRCECGTEKRSSVQGLLKGDSSSCGCAQRDKMRARAQHGGVRGGKKERLYVTWGHMRARCRNPKHAKFQDYGGRGIRVCAEWEDYAVFRTWAMSNGYGDDLQIDRIDNNGGYHPANCRFVTRSINQQNRRVNVFLTAFGETKCFEEWTRDPRCVVGIGGLRKRLAKGIPVENALTNPLDMSAIRPTRRMCNASVN